MLISRASEAKPKERKRGHAAECRAYSHEYQTANELFEIMAKNHPFDKNVSDSLSASDLVILYKNIEMGTKLMSEVGELKHRAPNQYVETIVYKDEADSNGSDASDIYTGEDLRHAVLVNNERIDLLSNPPSLENTLCHKFGDLEMRASNLSTQYDKHFLFKDPYIKEQLRNLSMLKPCNDFDNEILPASLLDYICCKRLEDNYNFYMDNVIKYVKHTIDQLKRISNGDYLTDKAKEKWREAESATKERDVNNAKVLTTSASIPLQIERKVNGLSSTWDDIIHSEVDVRSLSKILEKKIIVEIPKLICGSYKFFSKFYSDNLVFSCKRENKSKTAAEKKEPRLDVVLQLGRSQTGQVMSNISSIMVWQANPSEKHDDSITTALLPIPYSEIPKDDKDEHSLKIVEIEEVKEETYESVQPLNDTQESFLEINKIQRKEPRTTSVSFEHQENKYCHANNYTTISESSSSLALRGVVGTSMMPRAFLNEAPFNFGSPVDLTFSIHRMKINSVPEESSEEVQKPIKRKSPTRVRVKSPYENKSYLLEERKRKKLLEIRERREKRKIAMGESCKITKHRYGKGPVMPRSSSSVTKLSITNKSFYNSIYGQNVKDLDKQKHKCKPSKEKRDLMLLCSLEQVGDEQGSGMVSPDTNNNINRSFYLDDAVTQIMYTDVSDCSSDVRELFSTPTSAHSNDLAATQTMHSTTIGSASAKLERFDETQETNDVLINRSQSNFTSLQNMPTDEPSTSAKNEELWKDDPKKLIPNECRKSIDKIYGLIKKLGNVDRLECKLTRSKCTIDSNKINPNVGQENSIQCSDSGTSLKHHMESSNASSFSFDKTPAGDLNSTLKSGFNKKGDGLTTVVPKVIISTKQQANKHEVDNVKKERKKVSINPIRVPENPLKAISQLLHEFDSVQKTRQKLPTDSKGNKKPEVSFDGRYMPRIGSGKNRARLESYDVSKDEHHNEKAKVHKERRTRPTLGSEPFKGYHQAQNEDKHVDRRKKLADIIDEVKEAKGEAVRGPSKLTSRLNSLAQPKKAYVQAMSEEYQTKHGRSVMSDRLQRLATAAVAGGERVGGAGGATPVRGERVGGVAVARGERVGGAAVARGERVGGVGGAGGAAATRWRPRRRPGDVAPAASPPPRLQPPLLSSLPPLERGAKHRRPASASPEKTSSLDAVSYKHTHAPDAPETHFKNKMVAVESYVKNHYGRVPQTGAGASGGGGEGGDQLRDVIKARVPLLPDDLKLSPVSSSPFGEECSAIGNKLHQMINNIIRTKPVTLSALNECTENDSDQSRDDLFDDVDYQCRIENPSSVDSDYGVDVFKDKNVKTVVQNFLDDRNEGTVTDEMSESNASKCDHVKAFKSATELQDLKNALHRQMSVGAFSKRLRIKNLTITPKQSMQPVFLWQSGDTAADSLLLHSSVSTSLKLNISRSISEKDMFELQSLMKPQTNWNATNIPMQITTVGYAFPQYHSTRCDSNSAIESEQDILKTNNNKPIIENSLRSSSYRSDVPESNLIQNPQCYEGDRAAPGTEREKLVSQVKEQSENIAEILATAVTSAVADEKKDELSEVTKTVDKSVQKKKQLSIDSKLEDINYTSSLDILVGLLTEIQNITACHISNTENYTDEQEYKPLESMLKNKKGSDYALKYNESRELISITCLDRLRQLDSNPSIFSLYNISNDEYEAVNRRLIPNFKNVLYDEKTTCVDKEVSAEFPKKELTNTLTDVPSLFPIAITHSTHVTSSLLEMLSKSSSQTMFSINDYETTYSDYSDCQHKIVEISQPLIEVKEQLPTVIPCTANISNSKNVVVKRKNIKVGGNAVIPFSRRNTRLLQKTCVDSLDSDPLHNMKRDILVTVYSMLVLTVFAALSIPDLLYYA